jgi:hypothetical protein
MKRDLLYRGCHFPPQILSHGGRVEDWRGGPLGSDLVCIRGFPVRARVDHTVTPCPAPSTSNAAGGFGK